MRIDHGLARKACTSLGVAGLLTAATLFIAPGTASAAVSKDCSTTVTGKMGESVSVTGESVMNHVRKGAQDSSGLDNWFVLHDQLANDIKAKGALKVGTVPRSAGGSVSGTTIGTVVARALEGNSGLGTDPDKTLAYIKAEVARNCGLTLKAGDYVAPTSATSEPRTTGTPAPPGTSHNAPPSVPGTAGAPSSGFGTGDVRAPRRDYGGLPFALPGATGGPSQTGGPAEFGGLPVTAAPDPAVSNAGNADGLAHPHPGDDIQLPMLLAVVALAGVAAALVRTWVLRNHHS